MRKSERGRRGLAPVLALALAAAVFAGCDLFDGALSQHALHDAECFLAAFAVARTAGGSEVLEAVFFGREEPEQFRYDRTAIGLFPVFGYSFDVCLRPVLPLCFFLRHNFLFNRCEVTHFPVIFDY